MTQAAEPLHVLLVEDNPGDARLVREALRDAVASDPSGPRYRVTVAERLADGFAVLDAGGVDVVMLDLELPDSSGIETYHRVRDRAPGCPIVVLTSSGDESLGVRVLREGAQDYLPKARFDAEGLARSVRYARERKQVAEERERLLERESAARRQAEETSRLKDEFLATISHELRTPLTSMLGWAQMLRAGTVAPERQGRAFATIERNARAQAQLIDDLLDMSRILSGKLRLETTTLDVVPVVEAALETVRLAADARGVQLQAELEPGCLVVGDATRLQQIVWNLLSNAVKFTPPGGRVQVAARCREGAVVITVSDTGQGIAAEFLPHVFERFRQADGGITRAQGGLGLGLSIVWQLVELHGGSVRVASEGAGRGATFTVRLPLTDPAPGGDPVGPASLPTSNPYPASAPRGQLAGLRLVVVDDEEDTRELLAVMLEAQGASVRLAASAAEARDLVAAAPPDVLLSDIGMPGENGYALIESLRRLPPGQGGDVPAVALTAYTRSEDRTRALTAGFSHHVPKPVDPAELLAVIASLIRPARPGRP